MNKQDIQAKIAELELELESLVPGDYSYDVVNSELELLYMELAA